MNSQGIVQLLKLSVSLAARLPPLVFETPDVKSLRRKGLQLPPSSSPHTAGRCIAQSYVPDQGATGPRPGGHAEADRDRRSQDRRLRALLGDAAAQQSASGAALKRSEWMQPNHAAKKGTPVAKRPAPMYAYKSSAWSEANRVRTALGVLGPHTGSNPVLHLQSYTFPGKAHRTLGQSAIGARQLFRESNAQIRMRKGN